MVASSSHRALGTNSRAAARYVHKSGDLEGSFDVSSSTVEDYLLSWAKVSDIGPYRGYQMLQLNPGITKSPG